MLFRASVLFLDKEIPSTLSPFRPYCRATVSEKLLRNHSSVFAKLSRAYRPCRIGVLAMNSEKNGGKVCVLLGFLALILGGCSNVPLETISISASLDANSSYATMIDVVVIYDQDLAAKISALPSSQYFSMVEQLQHDNSTLMSRWRWEIVPGQVITQYPIVFDDHGALAAFVFARYYTPGDHRYKLTPVKDIAILLDQGDFRVCELVEEGKDHGSTDTKTLLPLPQVSTTNFYNNARRIPATSPVSVVRFPSYKKILQRRLHAQKEERFND
jgi:type VI secretion system protein